MGRWSDGFDLKMIDYRRFLITPQVEAGSPVLILGFPWGMRSEEYAVPILRYGVVAVTDPNIVVDAMLFEGNSGGPVVHTPATPLGKSFTAPVLQGEWLVGLVSKEITFRILDKTGKVIREDRSGLCNVVPASAILELLESPQFKAVDTRTGNIGSK
jgi:hypothetical protein